MAEIVPQDFEGQIRDDDWPATPRQPDSPSIGQFTGTQEVDSKTAEEDEEEEEICCRICRQPATSDQVLVTPCKCSGSIRYVHQDCLLSWLNMSKRQTCELCGHKFQFRGVYAAGAPSRLPLWQVAWMLAKQSWQTFKYTLRVLLVMIVWGFSLPLLTCYAWRLSFYTPFVDSRLATAALRERLNAFAIIADLIQGTIIGVVIVFLCIFSSYVADHTKQYWQLLNPAQEPAAEAPAAQPEPQPRQRTVTEVEVSQRLHTGILEVLEEQAQEAERAAAPAASPELVSERMRASDSRDTRPEFDFSLDALRADLTETSGGRDTDGQSLEGGSGLRYGGQRLPSHPLETLSESSGHQDSSSNKEASTDEESSEEATTDEESTSNADLSEEGWLSEDGSGHYRVTSSDNSPLDFRVPSSDHSPLDYRISSLNSSPLNYRIDSDHSSVASCPDVTASQRPANGQTSSSRPDLAPDINSPGSVRDEILRSADSRRLQHAGDSIANENKDRRSGSEADDSGGSGSRQRQPFSVTTQSREAASGSLASHNSEAGSSKGTRQLHSWKDVSWDDFFKDYLRNLRDCGVNLYQIGQVADEMLTTSKEYGEGRTMWAAAIKETADQALNIKRVAALKAAMFSSQGYHGFFEHRATPSGGREYRMTFYSGLPLVLPHRQFKWDSLTAFEAAFTHASPEMLAERDAILERYYSFLSQNPDLLPRCVMGFTLFGSFQHDLLPWLPWSRMLEPNCIRPAAEEDEESIHFGPYYRLQAPGDAARLLRWPLEASAGAAPQLRRHRGAASLIWQRLQIYNAPGPNTSQAVLDTQLKQVLSKLQEVFMESVADHLQVTAIPELLEAAQTAAGSEPGSICLPFPSDLQLDRGGWPDQYMDLQSLLQAAKYRKAWIGNGNTPQNIPIIPRLAVSNEIQRSHSEPLLRQTGSNARQDGNLERAQPAEIAAASARDLDFPGNIHNTQMPGNRDPQGDAHEQGNRQADPVQAQHWPAPPAGHEQLQNLAVPAPQADNQRPRNAAAPPPAAPANQNNRANQEVNLAVLLGLEGSIITMLGTAGLLLCSCWLILMVFLWAPFVIGQMMHQVYVFSTQTLGLQAGFHPLVYLYRTLGIANQQFSSLQGTALSNHTSTTNSSVESDLPLLHRVIVRLELDLAGTKLNDWLLVVAGYGCLLATFLTVVMSYTFYKYLTSREFRQKMRTQRGLLKAAVAHYLEITFAQATYTLLIIKVSLILVLEMILLPTLYGCWVDLCALPLFDSTWRDRLVWLQLSPISFCLLHWGLGLTTLLSTATLLSLVRKELRRGALPFFRDPFEREDEPLRDMVFLGFGQQVERQFCALGMFACLAVVGIHIPLRLARHPAIGVVPLRLFSFPIELDVKPVMQSVGIVMYNCVIPWTISRLRFRLPLVAVLRFWLRCACNLLDLTELLLTQNGNRPPAVIPHGLFSEMDDEQRAVWREEVAAAKAHLPQLFSLLGLFLLSLIGFNTAVLVGPLLTGRALFNLTGSGQQHDFVNYSLGVYLLWAVGAALYYVYKLIFTGNSSMVSVLWSWLQKGTKLAVFAILGIGVLPVMIGLTFEHIVLPLRMSAKTTPAFFLYSDWASGLVFLRAVYTHVLRPNALIAPAGPRNQTSLAKLKRAIGIAKERGLTDISLKFGVTEILWPMLSAVGVILMGPYVITKGLLPRLPGVSVGFAEAAYMHAWWGQLVLAANLFAIVKVWEIFQKYRAKLRDTLYLERRELINLQDSSVSA